MVLLLLLCGVFIPKLYSLGVLTLETLTVYDAGSQSKFLLVESQFLVGAGNAYATTVCVKTSCLFWLYDFTIQNLLFKVVLG